MDAGGRNKRPKQLATYLPHLRPLTFGTTGPKAEASFAFRLEVRYCLASGVGSGVGRGERERAVRRKPEALSTDAASRSVCFIRGY